MAKIIVYKVKDTKTDLYMSKGGYGFDKKGKTWESLGKLKVALQQANYWTRGTYLAEEINSRPLPGPHLKIIEIEIEETEAKNIPLSELVAAERRYVALGAKYGSSFQELVERIEKQGQNDQFQWVLSVGKDADLEELLEIVKGMKLKQNKDYKRASARGAGGVVAFASKAHAMQAKLSLAGRCFGIDIKNYVETNLDDAA